METTFKSTSSDLARVSDCIITPELFSLFSSLKGVLVFVKDKDCTILHSNLLLAEHCGFQSEPEMIGKNDFDIFPVEIAEQYREDDLEVMRSGKVKDNIVELFPNYLGDLAWFVTSKVPLRNKHGEVRGICGILQAYENASGKVRSLGHLAPALDYIKDNYTKKISNESLASCVGLSVRQFEIKFKEIFQTTARQYILRLRILKACDLLLVSDLSILEVAMQLGFYDQSAFSLYFKRQVGMTPLGYIKKHSDH